MDPKYNPQPLETALQQQWAEQKTYEVDESSDKPKFYCLSMLPYPSGQLHMGHVRNYTIGDMLSRYQRMRGKNVLQPMGWDAFGLPAENAAIKHKVPPAKWTYQNIEHMKQQLQRLGFSYDWSRELATCTPEYYRWEQWLFTRMMKKGLAYRKKAMVNWDPVDQTVLANEQVVNGCGWRSGAPVERREISQWFLKITDYADELLEELDNLPGWPDAVKIMQRNWIGRSEGINITFDVNGEEALKAYTTRPDTLMGVAYVCVAPQHPLALKAAEKNADIQAFLKKCKHGQTSEAALATAEKEGMDLGIVAKHPLTGDPVPVWVTNYVLMEYGTGVVMAVPAHDERDYEFSSKYMLPVPPVIQAPEDWDYTKKGYFERGTLINSGEFDGMDYDQAFAAVLAKLEALGKGEKQVNYRLRDWGISRQRYWGAPIPVIHCEDCDVQPVPEADLPVILPEDVTVDGTSSPLAGLPEFVDATCPACGKAAKRETDTFDTFMESSWYYLRYNCPGADAMVDKRGDYWSPIDQYIGGVEHAVMHLMYARFLHKVMRDEGLVHSNEPFTNLLTQGMVLKDGAKMSKSKGNTVDPQALIDQYGADTVRLFAMFAAPPTAELEWSDKGVDGAYRYLNRVWQFTFDHQAILSDTYPEIDWKIASDAIQAERRNLHQILKQATFDYERLQFNTVVSACMKISNLLQAIANMDDPHTPALLQEGMSLLLRLLAPITPHLSAHLWETLGFGDDLDTTAWPEVDDSALQTSLLELMIQINGKLRSKISVPADADKASIETAAKADPKVEEALRDKTCRKVIVVPGKLVNIVVG